MESPPQETGQLADFAEPGVLAAGFDELIALAPREGVFQSVQGGVDPGRGIAAFDRIEADRPDIGALDDLCGSPRILERNPCALEELVHLLGVVAVFVPLHAVKRRRYLPLNVHCHFASFSAVQLFCSAPV
ncbi:hypothetical protein D9M72_578990 [compost metagenome]